MKGPVKTYMSGDPVSISSGASALEAFEAMLDHGIRHLPVVDARNRVVGVLSIDDVRAALPYPVSLRQPLAPSQRDAALELRVGEIMTHDPDTLGEEATLAEAAECMAERRIGCVPIVDEHGELAGLLSETDVLWAVATAGGAHRKTAAPPGALDSLVAELSRERERVRKRLASRLSEEQSLEAQTREEPMDRAEIGADVTLIAESMALDELAVKRLAALDKALDRAARRELTVCAQCGGPIAIPRLRALPGATTCIACARAQG